MPWYRTGLGALTIVLALIGALVWVFRRWAPTGRCSESRAVSITGRATLSPKHSAVLIRVGRRLVLVGISGERMNTLCEISDPEEVAEVSLHCASRPLRSTAGFDRVLMEETAAYDSALGDDAGKTAPLTAEAVRTRRPLSDLLRRLRTLQAGR